MHVVLGSWKYTLRCRLPLTISKPKEPEEAHPCTCELALPLSRQQASKTGTVLAHLDVEGEFVLRKYTLNRATGQQQACNASQRQKATGAPFQWAALFHKKSVRFLKGVDKLMFFYSDDMTPKHVLPCKVSCSNCHSPMADEGRNMWMSFPTLFKFPDHKTPKAFEPTDHIFYGRRCIDIKDGAKKWSKHQDQSDQIAEE